MTNEQNRERDLINELLMKLNDAQQTCSDIVMSIGYVNPTNRQVIKNRVVLIDCPPAVVTMVVKDDKYRCSMVQGVGLVIEPKLY